tara:strand:+ start:48 stop:593 length:546 start_codon:yes stop_codon:yes gene_type:complete
MIFEKFEDAIVEINGFTDPQFLKLLIDYADKKCTEKLHDGTRFYRRVRGHSLTKTSISDAAHFINFQNEINKAYIHYKFKFPQIKTTRLLQVDLLKYDKGEGYYYHTDDVGLGRTLSIIFNLNDDYEGGDLVFGRQDLQAEVKRIKMKSGTMCFFPSNFLYPHKIEEITKGTRYSVVAWLG